METNASQPSVWNIGVKGGLYTGLVLIILGLIINILELQSLREGWGSFLYSTISLSIGVYLTHKAYKEQGNGLMSYGQGLGLGTVMGLVAGILSAIFTVIYLTYIDPELIDRMMDLQRIQMEEQGMSDAQIDQAMDMAASFQSPGMLFLFATLITLFYAFLVSLIVSIFTKKNDPAMEY